MVPTSESRSTNCTDFLKYTHTNRRTESHKHMNSLHHNDVMCMLGNVPFLSPLSLFFRFFTLFEGRVDMDSEVRTGWTGGRGARTDMRERRSSDSTSIRLSSSFSSSNWGEGVVRGAGRLGKGGGVTVSKRPGWGSNW